MTLFITVTVSSASLLLHANYNRQKTHTHAFITPRTKLKVENLQSKECVHQITRILLVLKSLTNRKENKSHVCISRQQSVGVLVLVDPINRSKMPILTCFCDKTNMGENMQFFTFSMTFAVEPKIGEQKQAVWGR